MLFAIFIAEKIRFYIWHIKFERQMGLSGHCCCGHSLPLQRPFNFIPFHLPVEKQSCVFFQGYFPSVLARLVYVLLNLRYHRYDITTE